MKAISRALWVFAAGLLAIAFGAARATTAQHAVDSGDAWADWQFMIGEWTATDSSGVHGAASKGSFTLTPGPGGKFLVRQNHAEYPPRDGQPGIVHDDTVIIYREHGETRALYDDNEGQVIHYTVSVSEDKKRIVFVSEKHDGAPQFRLTYESLEPNTAKVLFEIAPPNKPGEFKKYVDGTVKRKA